MTGSVPSGASGLLGPSAAPPVARVSEPDRGRVMDPTSESVTRTLPVLRMFHVLGLALSGSHARLDLVPPGLPGHHGHHVHSPAGVDPEPGSASAGRGGTTETVSARPRRRTRVMTARVLHGSSGQSGPSVLSPVGAGREQR